MDDKCVCRLQDINIYNIFCYLIVEFACINSEEL